MITDFSANNYRLFREFSLSGLKRVNIIFGDSAAGKSSLLEAIKLSQSASPQTAANISASRGLPLVWQQNSGQNQFESLWGNLFFDFDINNAIDLSFTIANTGDKKESKGHANIFFDRTNSTVAFEMPQLMQNPLQDFLKAQTSLASVTPIVFLTEVDDASQKSKAHINQNGILQFESPPAEIGLKTEMLPSPLTQGALQLAIAYSQLSINKSDDTIKNAIIDKFPVISDISIQATLQGPTLYADLHGIDKKIPFPLISSGINKILSILITIASTKNGVVLIDEIENGIYFKNYEYLWRLVDEFSLANNTQVFISSHSKECVLAAKNIIMEKSNNYSLIQMYLKDGNSDAIIRDSKVSIEAMENGIELR